MTALISTYNNAMEKADHASGWLTPTLARVVFIAVLFVYYWNSATLKIDGSIFSPSAGAFGQIFPKAALVDRLFSYDEEVTENAIEVYVGRLRRRLEGSNLRITTVRGLGYRLDPPKDS